jgi:hypothetical protein
MYFSRRNPIPYANFLNTKVGSAFVNKSARFSLERICWTVIIPSFWRSWVKKNFGEMCFTLSPFIYPSFNWVMQVVLSSCITIGAYFSESKLHTLWIWCVIFLNQTHSLLASWIAKIFAWLDEVAAIVCFIQHHEIDAPPHNKYISRLWTTIVWIR